MWIVKWEDVAGKVESRLMEDFERAVELCEEYREKDFEAWIEDQDGKRINKQSSDNEQTKKNAPPT